MSVGSLAASPNGEHSAPNSQDRMADGDAPASSTSSRASRSLKSSFAQAADGTGGGDGGSDSGGDDGATDPGATQSVTSSDASGSGALHLAVRNGSVECVKKLLDAGAPMEDVDARGKTAKDLAHDPVLKAARGNAATEELVAFLATPEVVPAAQNQKSRGGGKRGETELDEYAKEEPPPDALPPPPSDSAPDESPKKKKKGKKVKLET